MKFRGLENWINNKPEPVKQKSDLEVDKKSENIEDVSLINRAKTDLEEEDNFDPTTEEIIKRALRIKLLCKTDEEMAVEILSREIDSIREMEDSLRKVLKN